MTFKDYDTPTSRCLDCGREMDAATNVSSGRKPKPGDITICIYCGHIMAFGKGLALRALTDKEMLEVAGDPQIIKVRRAINHVMSKKKSPQC